MLTRVRKQQAEEAEAFAAELRKREEELGAVLLDSRSNPSPNPNPNPNPNPDPNPNPNPSPSPNPNPNPNPDQVLLDSRSKSALLAEALASQSASQAKLQAGRTR